MVRTPTLEDVADVAGVSTATVSRCLNRPERVVEATRNRVLRAVAELGYSPNFSARALAAGRTMTIGVVIPTMDNAIFAEGIQAFQKALQAEGYMLLIATSDYDPEAEAIAVRKLVARGVDGVLLVGFDRSVEVYDLLEMQGVPAVVAWTFAPDGPVPSVGFDNVVAMEELAGRAIVLGHRHVGMISAVQEGNDRVRNRVRGVQAAVRAAGLTAAPVIETPYSFENGALALDRLLAAYPEVTLVICANDVLAAGAIRRARELGIAVPRDLSITGFDDIALARVVEPALTTVAVPHGPMGQAAAEALLSLVAGEAVSGVELPVDFRMRGSLGPPRSEPLDL